MIIWHNPKTNPPAAFRDVLLAETGKTESAEGWIDTDGEYWTSTGHLVAGEVYAWTELPACPPIDSVAESPSCKIETEEVQ